MSFNFSLRIQHSSFEKNLRVEVEARYAVSCLGCDWLVLVSFFILRMKHHLICRWFPNVMVRVNLL